MCTALYFQAPHGDCYFGRTMDFSHLLNPHIYRIPKGYTWSNQANTHTIQNLYTVLGSGQNIHPVILADGVNDMGFSAAALYFPGYADYEPIPDETSGKLPVAALELVNFLLGQCACVFQAAALLKSIAIIGVTDAITQSVAPLHWIISDKHGHCMTIEKTKSGLHLIQNPIGVLSNSPDFLWHMTNLNNYMGISAHPYENTRWNTVTLTPFGQGSGTAGLPGDYTPPSRFVRAAWLKSHVPIPSDNNGALITAFHIMESVTIPKGAVITQSNAADYTQYTAFINLNRQEYYFKTYSNSAMQSLAMPAPDSHTDIQMLRKMDESIFPAI